MEVIYTIHHNLEHCSVSINNKDYSYYSLKDLLKTMGKEYLKTHKLKKKSYSLEINDVGENFKKSNLTQDEIESYFFQKKESKAKSWLSNQRRLRKKGKLEKHKIDALNKLGMVWNPSEDNWEKNFSLFQKMPLVEILRQMRKKKYWVSMKEIYAVIELDDWIIKQRTLHKENKLSEENLTRLTAINFPFSSPLNNDNNEFKLNRLISLILWIDELSRIGAHSVANQYNLKQKVYVGGNVKINEKTILETQKELLDEYEEMSKEDDKYLISAEKEHKLAEENAIKILKEKSPDYFIKQIDKISRKYIPTWNDKNIYEIDKKGKRTAWGNADDRLAQLYFDRYSIKYSHLKNFLNNNFNFPRTKINNVVYEATYGKYIFDSEIKIYAAKKMITILDEHLLKTGKLNHKKTFKPIAFLLRYYQKNKDIEELLNLKEIIENHQLLTLIYSDRVNKIIKKFKNI